MVLKKELKKKRGIRGSLLLFAPEARGGSCLAETVIRGVAVLDGFPSALSLGGLLTLFGIVSIIL